MQEMSVQILTIKSIIALYSLAILIKICKSLGLDISFNHPN